MSAGSSTEPIEAGSAGDANEPGSGAGAASAVSVKSLCLEIDNRRILDNINLDIRSGESVALMGANGAGKSTLLRILATLAQPTSGELSLFGQRIGFSAAGARAKIGIISHQSMLYRDLSIRENLEFFGRLYDASAVRDRATELLGLVGLAARADDPVKTLSRGMIQRAAIARALMHDPALLLADEPFDGLDAPSTRSLAVLWRRLRDEGRTLIMANHYVAQSLSLTGRAVVLRRGRVVLDGSTDSVTTEDVLEEISRP